MRDRVTIAIDCDEVTVGGRTRRDVLITAVVARESLTLLIIAPAVFCGITQRVCCTTL